MKRFRLLQSELLKIIGDLKAYWFNYLFGNLNVFFMFLGIFYAFPSKNPTTGDIFNFLMGLMIWYYGVHAIDLIAIIIEEEIIEGTLEQIFMSRVSFIKVLFNRIVTQLVFDTIKGIFVFALCVIAFKIPLDFLGQVNWLYTLVIFFITLIGLYGIGYMVAGISLIYQKATSVAGACSNLLLFFTGIIISIDKLPIAFRGFSKTLPLYWGINSLKDLCNYDFRIMEVVFSNNFLYLLLSCAFWIVMGIIVFKICERKAKINGVLNQY